MDASIRLRRPNEKITIRSRSTHEVMLEIAHEFKYLLDVQPAHTVFNPGGSGDARESASYARAARLLDEAVTQSGDRGASPGPVLTSVVPVVDFVSDTGRQTPAQSLDILQRVRETLLRIGFNKRDQRNRSSEDGSLLEIRVRLMGQADEVFELVQGMEDAVHCVTPNKVNGQTFCHAAGYGPAEDCNGNR